MPKVGLKLCLSSFIVRACVASAALALIIFATSVVVTSSKAIAIILLMSSFAVLFLFNGEFSYQNHSQSWSSPPQALIGIVLVTMLMFSMWFVILKICEYQYGLSAVKLYNNSPDHFDFNTGVDPKLFYYQVPQVFFWFVLFQLLALVGYKPSLSGVFDYLNFSRAGYHFRVVYRDFKVFFITRYVFFLIICVVIALLVIMINFLEIDTHFDSGTLYATGLSILVMQLLMKGETLNYQIACLKKRSVSFSRLFYYMLVFTFFIALAGFSGGSYVLEYFDTQA